MEEPIQYIFCVRCEDVISDNENSICDFCYVQKEKCFRCGADTHGMPEDVCITCFQKGLM